MRLLFLILGFILCALPGAACILLIELASPTISHLFFAANLHVALLAVFMLLCLPISLKIINSGIFLILIGLGYRDFKSKLDVWRKDDLVKPDPYKFRLIDFDVEGFQPKYLLSRIAVISHHLFQLGYVAYVLSGIHIPNVWLYAFLSNLAVVVIGIFTLESIRAKHPQIKNIKKFSRELYEYQDKVRQLR